MKNHSLRVRLALAAALALSVFCPLTASAFDTKLSGRIAFGAAYRLEEPAPHLLVSYNASAIGLQGYAAAGQNTDDGNNNFRRGDAITQALHAYLDWSGSAGDTSVLLRVKAWHDFALRDHGRPWGNSINGYAQGEPLSDRGAPRLGRFSGVALSDYVIEHGGMSGTTRWMARVGQQSLAWGERGGFGGGLGAVSAGDMPAMHRAGAAPQEIRVAAPMLFARMQGASGVEAEAFYQSAFKPSVLDLCGTLWAVTDYTAEGCNRTFSGAVPVSDRGRLASGSYLKRIASPTATDRSQFGAALLLKSALPDTDVGIYHARYTSRTPVPGLRKAGRAGPGLVLNDPDGKNLAFFTEYVGAIDVMAATFVRKLAHGSVFGELALRPHQPVQLPAGDVLPAFLNPAAPSLMRADADAVGPGGYYHAYDRYRTTQLQIGAQHDWPRSGAVALSHLAEIVVKHARGLPLPALRRYGRADQFGNGPVNGVCTVTSVDAARQCSFDGFVSATAWAYRLRLDARFALPVDGLLGHAWAAFTHDVKGWSYDFQINEGRRGVNIGTRADYRQRYFVELVFMPVWGGRYNSQVDRDQLSVAVGTRF